MTQGVEQLLFRLFGYYFDISEFIVGILVGSLVSSSIVYLSLRKRYKDLGFNKNSRQPKINS